MRAQDERPRERRSAQTGSTTERAPPPGGVPHQEQAVPSAHGPTDEELLRALTPKQEAHQFAPSGFKVVGAINHYEILATRALFDALRDLDDSQNSQEVAEYSGTTAQDAEERLVGVDERPAHGYLRGLTETFKARLPASKANGDATRGSGHDVRPEMAKTVVLHLRKQRYLARRAWLQGWSTAFALTAFGCLLATPALAVIWPDYPEVAGLAGAYAVIFFLALVLSRQRFRELDDEVVQIDHELDRIKVILQDRERRALKLFQSHSLELRRYYGQVLRHASFIFWVGVACIAAGFAVVGATIWLLVDNLPEGVNQWVLGGLGFVSGVLANFVAMIYLRMYSTTVSSLSAFHNRLVETHRLHFANFLASRVDEEIDRERTLAQMAMTLAVQQGNTSTNTDPTMNGGRTPGINADAIRRALRRRRAPQSSPL